MSRNVEAPVGGTEVSRRGLLRMLRPHIEVATHEEVQAIVPQAPRRMTGEDGITRRTFVEATGAAAFLGYELLKHRGPKKARDGITQAERKALDEAKKLIIDEKTRKEWEAIVGEKIGERDFRVVGERDYLIRVKKEKTRELFGVNLPASVTRSGGELTMHYTAFAGINGSGLPIPSEISEDGKRMAVTLPYPIIVDTKPDTRNKDFHLSVEMGLAERVIAQLKRNSGMDSMSPDEILRLAFGLIDLAESSIPRVYLQSDIRFQQAAVDALVARTEADMQQLKDAYGIRFEQKEVKFRPKPGVKDPLPPGVFIDMLDQPTINPENPLEITTPTTNPSSRIQARAQVSSVD